VQNFPIQDFVDRALADPQAIKLLQEFRQTVDRDPVVTAGARDDCLLFGAFARGVEHGAGASLRSLISMSNVTAQALASVRSVLPILGDEEHATVSAALEKAYEQTREARDMARYLAVSTSASRFSVPAAYMQGFLDSPKTREDYIRFGLAASLSAPAYFSRFVIAQESGRLATAECRCEDCVSNAALAAVLQNSKASDALSSVDSMNALEAFGRTVIDNVREMIDMLDREDIRSGHDAGEPAQKAEDLLQSLLQRSRGAGHE
jgi:hypothetical protein